VVLYPDEQWQARAEKAEAALAAVREWAENLAGDRSRPPTHRDEAELAAGECIDLLDHHGYGGET
jgi:hypothetical protein